MAERVIFFVLRASLVAIIWVYFWRLVEPKTQQARVIRAVLLVAGLLTILLVLRIFTP